MRRVPLPGALWGLRGCREGLSVSRNFLGSREGSSWRSSQGLGTEALPTLPCQTLGIQKRRDGSGRGGAGCR